MKQKQIISPTYVRMNIVGACMLLLLMFTGAQATGFRIDEVKVVQISDNEISIQVRTDDGRPAMFDLYNGQNKLIKSIRVIHSKINYISGLKHGTYIYRCISSDGDEKKGKITLK